MSTSIVNRFFNENPKYLNDIYGINYVENQEVLSGWTDFTDIFCDSMKLWCIYNLDEKYNNIVDSFTDVIYGLLKRYFDPSHFEVKYIKKYVYKETDNITDAIVYAYGWNAGYLAVNVTFYDICFNDLIPLLEKILGNLRDNCILLRSIDVTVDCARISTRKIIEEYLYSHNLITSGSDIADKHSDVGDNCISFSQISSILNNTKTRVKIYNKFIQNLESCEVAKTIGSRLSHLVADPDTTFMEKVKRYRDVGYSRIEISVYGCELFTSNAYIKAMDKIIKEDLAHCPTFKVPLKKQWGLVVDKLTQFVAVYVEDTCTFAYCHWWNSFTKKKQGICKPNVGENKLEIYLANFSFNDRPIHFIRIKSIGGTYDIISHEHYKRQDGSTAMTLVPGLYNAMYPSRYRLDTNIMFKDVGLDICKNVYIEWPSFRLENRKNKTLVKLVKVYDNFDLSTLQEALPVYQDSLIEIEQPQSSQYQADYNCLQINIAYTVRKYGYSLFRNTEYLHLIFDDHLMVRCSKDVQSFMEIKIQDGVPFEFKVTKKVKSKGYHKLTCEFL